MGDLDEAFKALADSLVSSVESRDGTKYGPIAREENDFQRLVEEGDFENYFISRLPADQYARIKEIDGVDTLLVDTVSIPDEVLFDNRELFQQAYASQGGLAVGNRSGIASSLSDESSDINTVFDSNESRIPSKLLPVFEEALVLREVERRKSLSRGTVFDWRGEIAASYRDSGGDPQVAQNLISLCSTGYFDENDVFDRMYDELVLGGSRSLQEFQTLVGVYIKENPFAVFVRADGMNAGEVYHMTKGKLEEIGDYAGSPDFVDICGKGYDTYPILDRARDELNDGGWAMEERQNPDINQKILRVGTSR